MNQYPCTNPKCPNSWHQTPECPNLPSQGGSLPSFETDSALTGVPPTPALDEAVDGYPHKDLPATVENVEDFMEEAYLNHGNSEVFIQRDEIYMTVEAPNNSTMGYAVPIGSTMEDVYKLNVAHMEDFDADDEFNEFWSGEFGRHNGFTPGSFLEMLKEDEEYFRNTAKELRKLY